MLCDHVCNDYLIKHSIYDSCAIQKGKGITFAIERVKHHMRSHVQQYGVTGYILKLDIKDYYKNIKQDVLIQYMNKHIADEDLCNLMNHIITSYKQGLPMGNQCSQILANLYLDPLDHYIKEYWKIKGYVRYLDDMILLHVSKQYLQNVMHDLEQFLLPYGLTFNERKSHIYPITQGCDFIGWHFKVLPSKRIHMRLRKQSIKNIKRRIKTMNHDLKHGRLQLVKYTKKVKGTCAYLKQGNTNGLRRKLLKNIEVPKKEGKDNEKDR